MRSSLTKWLAWSLCIAIVLLYLFSFGALLAHRQDGSNWQIDAVWHIISSSLWQASLSTVLSLLLGILFARAMFYLDFLGKGLLYKTITFTWALPSLLVIFAIIGLWGHSGWLAKMAAWLGFEWSLPLYGLQGILLAHLFLNTPFAAKYCLSALNLIPRHQHQLAAQLNIKGWHYFRLVEYPMLRQILPYAFVNIFMICFTSFPIVLMLGGGPKYSTLEVAIYQAVAFDYDFEQAVKLILCQLLIGIGLQALISLLNQRMFQRTPMSPTTEIWRPKVRGFEKWGLQAVIIWVIFSTLTPLCSVLWAGLSVSHLDERFTNPELWQAVKFSLILSGIAALSVLSIAYLLALEARQLANKRPILFRTLTAITTAPLILPVFMLAVGLFLLLMEIELSHVQLLFLVGICNGLILLPYIYPLLFTPMWEIFTRHDKLAKSLGISGIRRWWIIEKSLLFRPLVNAFALAMSSSLGSFSVIAFFGSPDFSSLPYLLYQQLGSYRVDDAAVTALFLMLFTLMPFLLIEQKENP